MIKQLLNSVIAKYRDLSVSRRSIICLNLRLWQIIDLLATDKSRYFAQPRLIIVNYLKQLGEESSVLSRAILNCNSSTIMCRTRHRSYLFPAITNIPPSQSSSFPPLNGKPVTICVGFPPNEWHLSLSRLGIMRHVSQFLNVFCYKSDTSVTVSICFSS